MINTWENCYNDNWKGVITEASFTHPAKFSRGLIRRIYSHAIEHGWLSPGDTVLDPFGGVGLGALHANYYGLNWLGVELEPKFVTLGQGMACEGISKETTNGGERRWCPDCIARAEGGQRPDGSGSSRQPGLFDIAPDPATDPHYFEGNLDLFRKYARYDAWATLVQGDSRQLVKVIGDAVANGLVASPPYAQTRVAKNSGSIDLVKLHETYRLSGGGMSLEAFCEQQLRHSHEYGNSVGQLSNLPQGNLDGIVSSAEYISPIDMESAGKRNFQTDYGSSDGNLGSMKGGFNAVVGSPPYENRTVHDHGVDPNKLRAPGRNSQALVMTGYGASPGQLSNNAGETFWEAAHQVVEQCYSLLTPGAPAIWVCKDFVRNKERVQFCDMWRRLCEAVGFETVEINRAMLVKRKGIQVSLDGEQKEITVERKGFFRRLAEKKGSPRIDWEEVIVMRKPGLK